MKKIKLIIWVGLLLAGCNKFKDEINTNPNLPSEASATQLIANAELSLPGISSQPQGEYYAQFLSETQYPNLSLYNQVSHSNPNAINSGPSLKTSTLNFSKR